MKKTVAKIESAFWGPLSRKFQPNLAGNFSLSAKIFFGIASLRSVIGSGHLCHPLNQSENKPRTKRAWPLVFSRASGSLPVWTLKSDWLLVTFFLDSDCSVFITNAIQDHFRLSVEKCSIPRARILSISCQSKIVYGKRIQLELKITESWQFFLLATNWSPHDYFRTSAEISRNFWFSLSVYNIELSVKVNRGLFCFQGGWNFFITGSRSTSIHPILRERWKKIIAMTWGSNHKCWHLLGITQSFKAWLLKACVTFAWSFFYGY